MIRVRPLEWVMLAFVVLILAAILMPVTSSGHRRAPTTVCLSNVKQMGVATMIYMGDADDRYPLRDVWMDALAPYAKYESAYHCPLVPKGVYGYAFDSRLSGAKPPKDPARATLLFESVNPIRNASDPLMSLPNPGRHPGMSENPKAGRNAIGYADGHARAIPGGTAP